jgi:hypothetical protein
MGGYIPVNGHKILSNSSKVMSKIAVFVPLILTEKARAYLHLFFIGLF